MVEPKMIPQISLPRLIVAEALESALPLEYTSVSAQVTGPVANVVVTQRFGNPLQEAAELDYLFPLPENAAITGFDLQVGQRRIEGSLQEQETARNTYEEARGQGKRAGLFEQRRPNLFAVRLANVQVGETIHARVRYQQRVKFEDASYEFVYPMSLTPKYDSPEHPGEGEGTHAPIARIGERIGPVEINLAVDAGMPVGQPTSPSHEVEIDRLDERRFQVRLAGEHIPDHDFVLRYPVAGEQSQAAGWTSKKGAETFFLATLVPPALENERESDQEQMAREFVFVLDRSGSMSGEPILQARNALRACLRALNPGDTFRILLFDNTLEWYQPEPLAVTQEQVDRADAYLERVHGRGGTEIAAAMNAVLAIPPDAQRTRFVVFLTDGAVSAETRLLDGIRSRIGTARLFTFGIGPSVNRALLSKMAELGRGRASFLQLNEDIEGAIIRFQDSVSFPSLTDLSLVWENGKAWDVYPARLPDLYYGQPLEICGRLAGESSKPVKLMVKGKRWQAGEAKPVALDLVLPQAAGQDTAIERVWARARVDDLLEQMELEPRRADKIRAEVMGLALEYNLVTVYTSYVAIDTVDTAAGEQAGAQPKIIHVSQPLPQGLQPGPFMPGPQRMAVMSAGMAMPAAPDALRGTVERGRSLLTKLVGGNAQRQVSDSGTDEAFHASPVAAPQPVAPGRMEPVQGRADREMDREGVLRWLARTQKLDGSWHGSIEWTAVAVLAFVRAGHTTRSGSYRQALRRAVRSLVEQGGSASGQGERLAYFLRARALAELAEATGDKADQAAAQSSRLSLPPATNDLEKAAQTLPAAITLPAAGEPPVKAPAAIGSLDDLRLASLLRVSLPVPPSLFSGEQGDLARVWAATLSE